MRENRDGGKREEIHGRSIADREGSSLADIMNNLVHYLNTIILTAHTFYSTFNE